MIKLQPFGSWILLPSSGGGGRGQKTYMLGPLVLLVSDQYKGKCMLNLFPFLNKSGNVFFYLEYAYIYMSHTADRNVVMKQLESMYLHFMKCIIPEIYLVCKILFEISENHFLQRSVIGCYILSPKYVNP
jgi:hypothetical protein